MKGCFFHIPELGYRPLRGVLQIFIEISFRVSLIRIRYFGV